MRNTTYIQHHGVKGMKWGVRRYQNKDGTLTAAGRKRQIYLDQDGNLTRSGKRALKKLNDTDQKDNMDRDYRNMAKRNIERFGNKKDPMSKLLTKTNTKQLSELEERIEKNKKQIDQIIDDMKSQKVDVVLRYNPYADQLYYKQSDKQQTSARDAKLYRKEGIKITRDDSYRITSVKSENANKKSIKKVNKIARRGYY